MPAAAQQAAELSIGGLSGRRCPSRTRSQRGHGARASAGGQALDGLSAADLRRVYTRLLDAPRTHLTSFEGWLSR
jgi:hypothetical protein